MYHYVQDIMGYFPERAHLSSFGSHVMKNIILNDEFNERYDTMLIMNHLDNNNSTYKLYNFFYMNHVEPYLRFPDEFDCEPIHTYLIELFCNKLPEDITRKILEY